MTDSEQELREQLVRYARQMLSSGLVKGTSGNVSVRAPGSSWCLVTPSGVVKMLDFGIAKIDANRKLTATGTGLGSLYYTSPEQVNGRPPDLRIPVGSRTAFCRAVALALVALAFLDRPHEVVVL